MENYRIMTEQNSLISQLQDRIKIVSYWDKRLEKLSGRKRNAMSAAVFCRKHGICQEVLSRGRTGSCLPQRKTIQKVEAALQAEGV